MKKVIVLLAASVLGCGTDHRDMPSVEILPTLDVPDPPTNGVQIITAPFDNIQPGGDYEVCTWTDVIVDKATDLRSTLGKQTEPPGHHMLLYYTLEKQPPGTQRECTDTDMATFRYLTGVDNSGALGSAPGDLVFHIPAGAQVVLNQHFLNATDEVLRGQSAMNLNYAEPGNWRQAAGMTVLDSSISVPQGDSTFETHCTFDKQY